jgi:hypothetical protein
MLGTDEHQKAIDYAKDVIPQEYFEDIPYKGEIK